MTAQGLQEQLDCYTAQTNIEDLEIGLHQLMRRASDTAYSVFLDRINWKEDAAFVLNPGLLARLPSDLSVPENPTRFILEGVEIPVVLENMVPYSDGKTFVYLLVKKIAGLEILGPPILAVADQDDLDFVFGLAPPDEDQPVGIKNLAPWLQGRLEIDFRIRS